MIFNGKPIDQISNDEIDVLVNEHIAERQHLEFKATINYQKDAEKLELLRDIVSFANAGSGYIVVGIRDDGKGKAQKYASELIGDTKNIKKSVQSLCIDYISERIYGLEVETREVHGNPLVLIWVPPSNRTPHMVTFQNRTDFWSRYHDGKREMTFSEIKEAFHRDAVALRLTKIETQLSSLPKLIKDEKMREELKKDIQSGITPQLSSIDSGSILSKHTGDHFVNDIGDQPCLWIAVTPESPKQDLININSQQIQQLFKNPPDRRSGGFNMEFLVSSIEHFDQRLKLAVQYPGGIQCLELCANGHMEFRTPLGEIFCWRQSQEEFRKRPRLYSYPVIEYPTTFLRLYRAFVDQAGIKCGFRLQLQYRNLQGYALFPGDPDNNLNYIVIQPVTYKDKHLIIDPRSIGNDFIPDKEAYDLIETVYARFGFESKDIPFYNSTEGNFNFLS
ncbi:ATP-binding protein [Candidatus Sumerlaeota bacterium]|nr:ATP-binding protein [Candidatus Sumerlaeota bacterium]